MTLENNCCLKPLTPSLSPPAATVREHGGSDGERVAEGRVRGYFSGGDWFREPIVFTERS
jgi:hypothetical protein